MRKAPIALLTLAATGVLLFASGSMRAQTPEPQQTPDVVQQQRRQMNQIEEMLRPLNLTPDQEERIQAIYAEMETSGRAPLVDCGRPTGRCQKRSSRQRRTRL